jgi:hypothetical protein
MDTDEGLAIGIIIFMGSLILFFIYIILYRSNVDYQEIDI